jgi:hypothetical protein
VAHTGGDDFKIACDIVIRAFFKILWVCEGVMNQVFATVCLLLLFVSPAFAQTDRGTITGTVSDVSSAVIPGVNVIATNSQTSSRYETISTETGNYTLTLLPAGVYELTAELPGFKRYVRQGITVVVAQTLRIDVTLEVGATTDEVTVTADAPMLRTESGEVSHNVRTETVTSLPVMSIGAGAGLSQIRNPQAVMALLPGVYMATNTNFRVNGAQGNTSTLRIEGQDASNGLTPGAPQQTQPSIDAIQEVTVMTSNFAAEYGQVGGGFLNYTMRSGTNEFHGSAYDYFTNEALNAGHPWLGTRPRVRQNNYGFTLGGPVYLPGLYHGRNRTFFFFNFEQYLNNQNINNQTITVPTQAYRDGDFRQARTTRVLGTDPLGRQIIEGTIYDPSTTRPAPDGRLVRDPFPDNIIPVGQMDPVALRIQSLIPAATRAGLTNNAILPYRSTRTTYIPSVKLDHSFSTRGKLSYYWSRTRTNTPIGAGGDGLPEPITSANSSNIKADTQRLNYTHTLSPTLLLHAGAGYQGTTFISDPPVLDYNAERGLGLRGATVHRLFPSFTGMSNAQGGMKDMGSGSNRHPLLAKKPTATASLTWVKNNHTYKFGSDLRFEKFGSTVYTATAGIYGFSVAQTGLPYLQATSIGGGTIGHPYASFLLGAVDNVQVQPTTFIDLGKHQLGFYAQDSWKVARRLTLDYGLRWDHATYLRELEGRLANFSPTTPNPSAGGLPGAVIFEGSGQGRCDCKFAENYPYAFQPRLGAAYQITSNTVLRLGFGIVYSGTADSNSAVSGGLTAVQPVNSPAFGEAVMNLRSGIPFAPLPYPNFDVGQHPQPGYAATQGGTPTVFYDPNAGRPARQWQWSVGIQREILQNLVVEAAYVGNRGVWWNSPGLIDVNGLTPERIRSFGLNLDSAADRSLLIARLDSPTAAARGFRAPYAGYPLSATVAQSLRPFPHFASITSLWSPLGKTWYDSLQVKATKRFSQGLTFTSNFTWSKNLALGAPSNVTTGSTGGGPLNDVFNRDSNKSLSQFDQPFIFNTSLNYTSPTLNGNKVLSWALRDWTIGVYVLYASGTPILAPAAQNNLNPLLLRNVTGALSYANRVPGEPLFTQDLNCHCFDPSKEFVLNPNAWAEPPAGQFGTGAAYYSDYRYPRAPRENLAIGRTFRFGEDRVSFNIRAEFTNIFNRVVLPESLFTVANARQTPQRNTAGMTTAGFGRINTASVPGIPTQRQGMIVGRLTF